MKKCVVCGSISDICVRVENLFDWGKPEKQTDVKIIHLSEQYQSWNKTKPYCYSCLKNLPTSFILEGISYVFQYNGKNTKDVEKAISWFYKHAAWKEKLKDAFSIHRQM